MLLRDYALACGAFLALSVSFGCAAEKAQYLGPKAEGPVAVALDAGREPWVIDIEQALRVKGIKVYRMPSQKQMIVKVDETTTTQFNAAATRYVLQIDGDTYGRCAGGGYGFTHLTTTLVDTKENVTTMALTQSGHSENCQPLSGVIFSNIAESVLKAWQ